MNKRKMQKILKKVAKKNGVAYETVCREIQAAILVGVESGHLFWKETDCCTPASTVEMLAKRVLCKTNVR